MCNITHNIMWVILSISGLTQYLLKKGALSLIELGCTALGNLLDNVLFYVIFTTAV